LSKLEPEKNKRMRVAILELLKTEFPGPLDCKVLQFSLDNLGYPIPEGALSAQLTYLAQKGYVRVEQKRKIGFEISFAALTAEGWDLLDGHIHEKGIDGAL
jgi:DNA-binding HxlR family transcriptional regulator